MGSLTIGLLGSRVSREVQRVRHELDRRGADALVVDLSGFPAVHRASLTLDEIRVGSARLDTVPVWLLRQLETPRRLDDQMTTRERLALQRDVGEAMICDREVTSLLESLAWSLSSGARVINHPAAMRLHGRKPSLTARLRRAGVTVPETLTTTDRLAAESFVEAHRGEVVCKAAAGGGEARLATDVLRELDRAATTLRRPLLFQRRIVGPSLRAYVVGSTVVSCAEVIHGDVVDWRTDQRGLRLHEVDDSLDALLRAAVEATSLDYAGVDVELDRDGMPYVLDVNPAPLFASYERGSGSDVAGALAALLIAEAESVS